MPGRMPEPCPLVRRRHVDHVRYAGDLCRGPSVSRRPAAVAGQDAVREDAAPRS